MCETMYRAKDVFCVKKAVVVTQEYHLYRSLYIANQMSMASSSHYLWPLTQGNALGI